MSDASQLIQEYKDLNQEYLTLADKWRDINYVSTTENMKERERMVILGRQIERKMKEIEEALNYRIIRTD